VEVMHSPRLLSKQREKLGHAMRTRPALVGVGFFLAIAIALLIAKGPNVFGQTTVFGIVTGSYFALGAVGLTLVYGVLRLVNFAQGDFLTFGAYMAFLINVTLGLPLIFGVLFAIAMTAAIGIGLELVMWRPMRTKGAGMLPLLLMSIGLAFVIRNGIQMVAGTGQRSLRVNVTSTITFAGLEIGRTELIVVLTSVVVLTLVGLMMRYTSLGRQMRALADNFNLAEATGIDTNRIVLVTWLLAGGLAGLAGVLYASAVGTFTPDLGFLLLLSLFAAVILGGIGDVYGALAGGFLLGLIEEWSTLVIEARWKLAVGFAVLIFALVLRPQGIFGRARTV
jgi:neutral amino acid transport system permease protein